MYTYIELHKKSRIFSNSLILFSFQISSDYIMQKRNRCLMQPGSEDEQKYFVRTYQSFRNKKIRKKMREKTVQEYIHWTNVLREF